MKTTREEAMSWWNKLNIIDKSIFTFHFDRNRTWQSLTGREIEIIWNKKVNNI